MTTGALTDLFCRAWGEGARWENVGNGGGPHEDAVLRLDHSRIRATFGWQPKWNVECAMEEVVNWTKTWIERGDLTAYMQKQIKKYFAEG